jgi:broad-specificity NMP kinase
VKLDHVAEAIRGVSAMLVAIFGARGTGKSGLARELSRRRGGVALDCDHELSKISASSLDRRAYKAEVAALDRRVRAWAAQQPPSRIVEGRYVDSIFGGRGLPDLSVALGVHPIERAERLSLARGRYLLPQELAEEDAQDERLRVQLYRSRHRRLRPTLRIDATDLSQRKCLQLVLDAHDKLVRRSVSGSTSYSDG